MRRRAKQAGLLLGVMIAASLCGGAAPPAPAVADLPPRPPGAAATTQPTADAIDLAARCDAAVRSAVRSTYGWGWSADAAADDAPPAAPTSAGQATKKPAAPPPRVARDRSAIDVGETAAIGAAMLWSADVLGRDDLRQAALEAGRGLATLQTRSGQVRARGLMAAPGLAHDPPTDVPDRAATRAALGLWLALLDKGERGVAPADGTGAERADPDAGVAAPPPDAAAERGERRVRTAAMSSAHWLAAQQTPAGGWPSAYPPDAPLGKAFRILRLDTRDARDDTYAVLLAGEVLDSKGLRLLYDRAIEQWLALRVPLAWAAVNRPLWAAAYDLQGQPTRRFAALHDGVDLLASRYAMQVLTADYLMTLKPRGDAAVREAAAAIRALPRDDKRRWRRTYDRNGEPIEPDWKHLPAGGLFHAPDETGGGLIGTFGLDDVLAVADRVNDLGGDRFGREIAADRSLRRRLAETLCGLSDDPLDGRMVGDPREASAPTGPSARATELWRALLRTRVPERKTEPGGLK